MVRGEIARWLYSALLAAVSIAVALLLLATPTPNWLYGSPGMVYGLLGFTHVVMARYSREPARA